MSTRKLLTNGNAFKRTDNRWGWCCLVYGRADERQKEKASQVQQKPKSTRK